jgi:hypothetical protein
MRQFLQLRALVSLLIVLGASFIAAGSPPTVGSVAPGSGPLSGATTIWFSRSRE